MRNELEIREDELQLFLADQLLKSTRSTTVFSVDEIRAAQSSLRFVLHHSQRGKTAHERFADGKQRLKDKLHETKQLYLAVNGSLLSFGVASIEESIASIGKFFKSDDIDSAADQVGEVWIDYQLSRPVDTQQFQGVDYIFEYLFRFSQEADFIRKVPVQLVTELLEGYRRQLKFDYTKDINNLFEVVFNQLLAKVFVMGETMEVGGTLLLTPLECGYLFSNKQQLPQCEKILRLVQESTYYQTALNTFLIRLEKIESEKGLANFLICRSEGRQERLRFTLPMSNESYLRMLEEISSRQEQAGAIIAEQVTSPYDLLELLVSEVIERREAENIIGQLPFQLFSALLLLLKQRNYPELESVGELFLIQQDEWLISAVRRRVTCLDEVETQALDRFLKDYQLEELDFS